MYVSGSSVSREAGDWYVAVRSEVLTACQGRPCAVGKARLLTGRSDGNLISAGVAVTVQGEVIGSLIGAGETVRWT